MNIELDRRYLTFGETQSIFLSSLDAIEKAIEENDPKDVFEFEIYNTMNQTLIARLNFKGHIKCEVSRRPSDPEIVKQYLQVLNVLDRLNIKHKVNNKLLKTKQPIVGLYNGKIDGKSDTHFAV